MIVYRGSTPVYVLRGEIDPELLLSLIQALDGNAYGVTDAPGTSSNTSQ